MRVAKKRVAKRTAKKRRAVKKKAARRSARSAEAAPAALPAPITGVPKSEVGRTVQDFLDFDGVHDVAVREDPNGSFAVIPLR